MMEGGEERWLAITQDKKSDELVGILLREIQGDGVGFEWFTPRVSSTSDVTSCCKIGPILW